MKQLLALVLACLGLVVPTFAEVSRTWLRVVDRPTTLTNLLKYETTPDNNGAHFIASQVQNGGNYVVVFSKVNSLGDVLWCFTYQPSQAFTYDLTKIVADPSGDLYALLVAKAADNKAHIAKIAGATGSILWQKNLAAGSGSGLKLDRTSQPIVTTTADTGQSNAPTVYKINSQTGATTWSRLASTLLSSPNSTSSLSYSSFDDTITLNVGKSTGVTVLAKIRDLDGSTVYVNPVASTISYMDPATGAAFSLALSTNSTTIIRFDKDGGTEWTQTLPFQLVLSFIHGANLYGTALASGTTRLAAISLADASVMSETQPITAPIALYDLGTCVGTFRTSQFDTYSFESLSNSGTYRPVTGSTFSSGSRPFLAFPFRLLSALTSGQFKRTCLYIYNDGEVPSSVNMVPIVVSGGDLAETPLPMNSREFLFASRNAEGLELASGTKRGLATFASVPGSPITFDVVNARDGSLSMFWYGSGNAGSGYHFQTLDRRNGLLGVDQIVSRGILVPTGDFITIDSSVLRCINHIDGSTLWTNNVRQGSGFSINSTVVANDGLLYLCDSANRRLFVVRWDSGELVRTIDSFGTGSLTLRCAGGKLFLLEGNTSYWNVSLLDPLGNRQYTTVHDGVLPDESSSSGFFVTVTGDVYLYGMVLVSPQWYLWVRKYDARVSEPRWAYDSEWFTAPLVDRYVQGYGAADMGGDAYFAFGGQDQQVVLRKLDSETGAMVWSQGLAGRTLTSILFGSTSSSPGGEISVSASGSVVTSSYLVAKDLYSSIQYEWFSQRCNGVSRWLDCPVGAVTQGSLPSTAVLDGDCLVVDGSDLGRGEAIVGFDCGLRSPDVLNFTLACSSIGSPSEVSVSLWDFVAERWVPWSRYVVKDPVKTIQGMVPREASRFVNAASREVRVRVGFEPASTAVDVPVVLALDLLSIRVSSD